MDNINNILNNFANAENPPQELTAQAYYARDIEMNLDFHQQFEHSMRKLGYHPNTYQTYRVAMFKKRIEEITNNFIENPVNNMELNLGEIYNNVMNEITNIINLRQERWNFFQQFVNMDDGHRLFYAAMNEAELSYLGF